MVRMFRTAYTEDFMAHLAHQSMSLWDNLETEAKTKLRDMTGLLNFGDPHYGEGGPEGTLEAPIKNLEKYGLKYTRLSREEIMNQHPFKDLPEPWVGIDMPDNGCINVNLLTRTLFRLCDEAGVDLVQYAEVQKIHPDPSAEERWIVSGSLSTEMGSDFAPTLFESSTTKIAITAGAFVNHVLFPSFGFTFDLNIWDMVAFFKIIKSLTNPKLRFPRTILLIPTSPSHECGSNSRATLMVFPISFMDSLPFLGVRQTLLALLLMLRHQL